MSVFFSRFGMFCHISSSKFSTLLFLPSGTHIIQMLFHLMLPQKVSACVCVCVCTDMCSFWVSPIALSFSLLICPSALSSLLLNLSSVIFFSVQILCSILPFLFGMCLWILCFLPLCWSPHCVHLFFSWIQWVSFQSLLWTLYQVDSWYLQFIKIFFWGFCLILSFGTYSSVSSFCLTLCVCFHALGKTATPPRLEGVTLCIT